MHNLILLARHKRYVSTGLQMFMLMYRLREVFGFDSQLFGRTVFGLNPFYLPTQSHTTSAVVLGSRLVDCPGSSVPKSSPMEERAGSENPFEESMVPLDHTIEHLAEAAFRYQFTIVHAESLLDYLTAPSAFWFSRMI